MNVVFLDFDGVVNIPFWQNNAKYRKDCSYNFPSDGTVNSYQAIQWVSEFCEEFDYKIVVSSTWRYGKFDYKKCLYDSGLREGIEVLGCTPVINGAQRGKEIEQYLSEHPEIENFLIFDDDEDMCQYTDRLVKCDGGVGFTINQFTEARNLHNKFKIVV